MSGTLIKIDVQDKATAQHMQLLVDRLTRPELLLRRIGEVLTESTIQRFAEQKDPDGKPWAPVSTAYAKRKAAAGKGNLINVFNGYLANSIRYQVAGSSVEVGTDRVYGAIRQFGGTTFAGQKVGHVRLKTDAEGALVRNQKGGAVFAKKRDPLHEVRAYATGYFENRQIARPYLGISASDRTNLVDAVADYLEVTGGG